MYKTKLKDTKHLQRHERARKRKKKNNLSPGIYLGDERVLTLFLIYTQRPVVWGFWLVLLV